MIAVPVFAHEGGHGNQMLWAVCESKPKDAQCSYQSGEGDTHRGTCQSMVDHMVCVENQPVERDLPQAQNMAQEAAPDDASPTSQIAVLAGLIGLLAAGVGILVWFLKRR